MRITPYTFLIAIVLFVTGCATTHHVVQPGSDRKLWKAIDNNPVFSNNHTGFALYDPVKKEWLCQFNSHKYFTPASNTKILTLLTSLHVLGDSIETFRYRANGDSLIILGMADPSFLWHAYDTLSSAFDFLKTFKGRIFIEKEKRVKQFGPGWAWDDYPYAYQVERSTFPIYGNRISVVTRDGREIEILPAYFKDSVAVDEGQRRSVMRELNANRFSINDAWLSRDHALEIPFKTSDELLIRLLADTLNREIELIERNSSYTYRTVYSTSRDSLLKMMMQESDNFIAEQLLMQCAFYMRGTFEPDSAIATAQKMILSGSPDVLNWADGSGLSRYNLFTPRSIVWVLEQLKQLHSMDYLNEIFPAGGRSGTIADWYAADPPYVFAKTGTLRNQHCLSGYLKASSGRWLIFSFMHNNFTTESKVVKEEMEKVLWMIRERY